MIVPDFDFDLDQVNVSDHVGFLNQIDILHQMFEIQTLNHVYNCKVPSLNQIDILESSQLFRSNI